MGQETKGRYSDTSTMTPAQEALELAKAGVNPPIGTRG